MATKRTALEIVIGTVDKATAVIGRADEVFRLEDGRRVNP